MSLDGAGAETHDSVQSPPQKEDIKLKNGISNVCEGFQTLNINPYSSTQDEESSSRVESDDVNELSQQIASLKRELFEEKQRRCAVEEKLVQVQLRMDQEIREHDVKYSKLDTKFIMLHKRAEQRIQEEEVDKEKDDMEAAQIHDANGKAEEASSLQLSSLQHEFDRTRHQVYIEPLKAMDSKSSIMDDSGRQSLFVVVDYHESDEEAAYFTSIIQLEPQINNHEYASFPKTQVIETEFSAHFRKPQQQVSFWTKWMFSTEAGFTEDLYMMPEWGTYSQSNVPLRGFIFNLRTKKCKPIKPPQAPKYDGHAVTLGRHIYFMSPDPVFECYNLDTDSWETLEPIPRHDINQRELYQQPRRFQLGQYQQRTPERKIVASAVWNDNILLNMGSPSFWAYNVGRNKWYPINVDDQQGRVYSIEGKAIVLGNTIYALTSKSYVSVLALSMEREEINGDLVYKCSLRSEISVPDMYKTKFEYGKTMLWNRHLVYLGKDNFCLVRSCQFHGIKDYQPIQVTYLKFKEEEMSMTVTDICVHHLRILDNQQFQLGLCFSKPEWKTTASKPSAKRIRFDIDPFPEDFVPEDKYMFQEDFESEDSEQVDN